MVNVGSGSSTVLPGSTNVSISRRSASSTPLVKSISAGRTPKCFARRRCEASYSG